MCIILSYLIGRLFVRSGTFGSVGFDTTVNDTTGGGIGGVIAAVGGVARVSGGVVGVVVVVAGIVVESGRGG